ncbi:MAG: hypothetical protein CL878_00395 [Dehalococcoidia bacterium]|nr:hypothetical protein [Dehalococcoidia bacterium]
MWREYAASAIRRGASVASVIAENGPLEDRTIVDVGCGGGGLAAALAVHNARVHGLELDPERIGIASRRARREGVRVTLTNGDALAMPLRNHSIDVVVCNDVIEHVGDAITCLREARRVLRPEGLLYLAVPNRWSLPNLRSDPHYGVPLVAALPRRWGELLVTRVWRKYPTYDLEALMSWPEIRRLLSTQGFAIQDRRGNLLDWRLNYLLAKLQGREPVLASGKRLVMQILRRSGLVAAVARALELFLVARWHYWVRGWAVVAVAAEA